MGNVSSNSITRIRMDGTRLIARKGRRTRTVRIADRLRLSPGISDSTKLEEEYFAKKSSAQEKPTQQRQ